MSDNNNPSPIDPPATSRQKTPPPLTLDEQDPVPHTSSKNSLKYVPVDPRCLLMLTDAKVEKFCDYIAAFSGFVNLPDSMKQPFTASTLDNEGDVTAYLGVFERCL